MSKRMTAEQKAAAKEWLKKHTIPPGQTWRSGGFSVPSTLDSTKRIERSSHQPKLVCIRCKRMRLPEEYAFKGAARCVACDRSESISTAFRGRLRSLLRGRPDPRMENIIGCTMRELVDHLERQFVDGMSWDNRREWHIDHVLPVCNFDHRVPEEVLACWHYSNLRPLWAHLNLKKGKRLDSGI